MNRLDNIAELLMEECPEAGVRFVSEGMAIYGRQHISQCRVIVVELRPARKHEHPETGMTPFGWWLHRQWVTRVPRIRCWPGAIELCWLGLRCTYEYNDWYVRKVIKRWAR